MFTNWVRGWARHLLEPTARFFRWLGLGPNHITVIGLILMSVVGYVVSLGYLRTGAVLGIIAGSLDGVDGTLARMTGKQSKFGAFLDSTLDRYAEIAIYMGILVYFLRAGNDTGAILSFATITGSLMVSYTRARAEGVDIFIKEGMLGRLERLLILAFGTLLGYLEIALWIISIFSYITSFQRIWLTWRWANAEAKEAEQQPASN